MKTVKFAETRPLPSYLVAIAVGDTELVDAGTAGQSNTRIRIAVRRGRTGQVRRRDNSLINLLANYFGIPYPYDKLDEVAIPLFGGAMENAGLVTYGSSIIMAKPDEDTLERQREWVGVASHELAHSGSETSSRRPGGTISG